jgi:nucleolar protein 56
MEILTWFGKWEDASCFSPFESIDEAYSAMGCWICSPEQQDLRSMAKVCGFAKDDSEYNRLLRDFAIGLVRRRLQSMATAEQDLLQMVEALDDLNEALNLLDERLYEWSRLHKEEVVHGKDLALSLKDDIAMGELARAILQLSESRGHLEDAVAFEAGRMAQNLSAIAGPVLAARLISRAGGMKRLSEMPASAIQVMGAEKSLFKHLRGNAPSPKHGLIYRHPAILGTQKRLRGKTSRALAGKLAIAARLDYHGGALSPELKSSLDRRLCEIRIGETRKRREEKPCG